jgi:hypothetical protein
MPYISRGSDMTSGKHIYLRLPQRRRTPRTFDGECSRPCARRGHWKHVSYWLWLIERWGANARKRTYPMKSLDILIDVISKTWLKVSMSARIHTRKAPSRRWWTDGNGLEGGITQRKIHRGRTGLRRADREGRRGKIEAGSQHAQAGDQTNFLEE